MKATELMIGDWVYSNYHQAIGTVTTLTRAVLWADVRGYEHQQLKYDEIEPIPITPDMLDKNGLESDSWVTNFRIIHVHQLQHALKLCGMSIEIEL